MAKILQVSANDLNKFFQNPTVHIGQTFDVSGFGGGNIPTIRDEGPAIVQVFLVSEPESPKDQFMRSNDEAAARHNAFTARNRAALYNLLVPKCAQERKCQVNVFFPGGIGGTGGTGQITFSGAGQTIGHGARHLAGLGVTQEAVEAAITADVRAIQSSASVTGSFWGRVTVQGHSIVYRAYTLPDGTINIGTYYKP